ncbi:MAG: hypothetical protein PHE87_07780, partial [Victivallaceae bacterium]|nr:hypothetical protein [Victivallaceae bacterium]
AGQYTITATTTETDPDTPRSATATVYIVGVDHILAEYDDVSVRSETDDPGGAETIYVKPNENVVLTAFTDPENTTWPAVNPSWSGGGVSGTGSTKTFNSSTPNEYTITATCGTSVKKIIIVVFTVGLTVENSWLTLKHDRECNLSITTNPSSVLAKINTVKIEIKRDNAGAAWHSLVEGKELTPWQAKIAGKFKLRGRVVSPQNKNFYSSEKNMLVEFPTSGQISADPTVISETDAEWATTLTDCTLVPLHRRRERGFWISLNTSTNSYSCGPSSTGDFVYGRTPEVRINLGPRPGVTLSSPAPNASGAIYGVASFHTHTPTTYCLWRPTGPSPQDHITNNNYNVAGLVYDYDANPAP